MTPVLQKTIETVWRIESARLVGRLLRLVQDVAWAEDLAQEALLAALESWPQAGIPDNPGAWLMATAKHRGLDQLRRQQSRTRYQEQLTADGRPQALALDPAILDQQLDDGVQDDMLRLILITCHPVLSQEARVALTLKLVVGLTVEELSRAQLVPEPTMAQRLVRAKRALGVARVPFEVPTGEALSQRIPSVLEVVYLIFNEGYAATRGQNWFRAELCEDAMRLGRILVAKLPKEPEVLGLSALMELHASRLRARLGPGGAPVLLLDQDRRRWDRLLIQRGLSMLAKAVTLRQPLGPYTLQAEIAACHARARTGSETNWLRIVACYNALLELTQSPVVALNRAVAVSMAYGPAEGLELVEELLEVPSLKRYHLLASVQADLLHKLGRLKEAGLAYERAARLTQNEQERTMLLSRAAACGAGALA